MEKKKILSTHLLQDIGLLGFLISIFVIILSMFFAKGNERMECLVMFLILFVPLILCAYKMRIIAYALTGIQILSYTIYKVYQWSAWNESITAVAYVWVLIPVLVIASFSLFIYASTQLEMNNEVLREQVEELVMVDSLTGLYNLRSLYNDLTHQMAYSERNDMKITLMIMQLKYEQELQTILSRNQFAQLRQKMAELVEDALRIEDRLYAVDQVGTLAMILTCDKAGAAIVDKRLKAVMQEKEAFSDIVEKAIKVDVKVGYLEYDKENITNAINFFKQTENELQYDV